MGIKGLHKALGFAVTKTNVTTFEDKVLAVDASCWLHRAGYGCAEGLNDPDGANKCKGTYTRFVVSWCEGLLANAKVRKLLIVFDGERCPLKADTNLERASLRASNLREARRHKAAGNSRLAAQFFRKCVPVTPLMTSHVIDALRSRFGTGPDAKVAVITSPYESDSQLARLCADGHADAVVTEDSDLLVYSATLGVPFPVIYKLDKGTGSCEVLMLDWLMPPPGTVVSRTSASASSSSSVAVSHPPRAPLVHNALTGVSGIFAASCRVFRESELRSPGSGRRLFVQACLLSGCDYLPTLPSVGVTTAFKKVAEEHCRPENERMSFVIRAKISEKGIKDAEKKQGKDDGEAEAEAEVEPSFFKEVVRDAVAYEVLASKAEAVFYHHQVYDMSSGVVLPLLDEPVGVDGEPPPSRHGKGGEKYVPDPAARFGDRCADIIGPKWTLQRAKCLRNPLVEPGGSLKQATGGGLSLGAALGFTTVPRLKAVAPQSAANPTPKVAGVANTFNMDDDDGGGKAKAPTLPTPKRLQSRSTSAPPHPSGALREGGASLQSFAFGASPTSKPHLAVRSSPRLSSPTSRTKENSPRGLLGDGEAVKKESKFFAAAKSPRKAESLGSLLVGGGRRGRDLDQSPITISKKRTEREEESARFEGGVGGVAGGSPPSSSSKRRRLPLSPVAATGGLEAGGFRDEVGAAAAAAAAAKASSSSSTTTTTNNNNTASTSIRLSNFSFKGFGPRAAAQSAPDAGGERKVVPLLASLFGGGQKSSAQQQQQQKKAGTKVTEGGTKTLKKGNIFDAFKRAA